MRILCLTKRRPQRRDLLTRPYGRFFYLPRYLAAQGHEVRLLMLDYQKTPPAQGMLEGIQWDTQSLRPWGLSAYWRRAEHWIAQRKPDWIIGFSDSWYGLMADRLGRKHGIRVLIDAYDNYESYLPWLKPLHWAWRGVLRRADAVSAAGPNLAHYMAGAQGQVVPMAADPIFYPRSRDECRIQLGLPLDKPLLGYSGALDTSRNLELLLRAFVLARLRIPQLELVLSGRGTLRLPMPLGVRHLGYLADEQMPLLMNSFDRLVVMNRASAFGHYSYPAKLYEAMRCEIPVIATCTDSVQWILQHHPQCLTSAHDERTLARHLVAALQEGPHWPANRVVYHLPHENCWQASGKILHQIVSA